MKFLFIIGDGAVGKMTVGQELAKITGMRLFYSHMMIDPVLEIFGNKVCRWDTVKQLCNIIFEEFADSDNYGMIFTYLMDFDKQSEWDFVAYVADIFKKRNADVYYVELVSPLEVRLQRNVTDNRLKFKPSKRNIEKSNQQLLSNRYRGVSKNGEVSFENYVKIDNTHLPPNEVAKMINKIFSLMH